MKIALIGATGFVGTAVLAELLRRGHQVTALVRHPTKLSPRPGVSTARADAYDADSVASAVRRHDGVKRLLVVGGAGSLFVAPGVQLVDTPEFAAHVPANVVLLHGLLAMRSPRCAETQR